MRNMIKSMERSDQPIRHIDAFLSKVWGYGKVNLVEKHRIHYHHPSNSRSNPSHPSCTSSQVAWKSPVYQGSATSRGVPV